VSRETETAHVLDATQANYSITTKS